MGSAVIFSGTKVKSLKSTLNLFDGADVISSSVDPTSSAVDAKRGSILLNTVNGNAYLKLDDGSSTNWVKIASGANAGINYILNPDAEVNTTGWATYADAAGTDPVDGTGGSPTVTLTRSTSSPLRGLGSFLITKDAANRQGEGASYAFTIDSADKNKILRISFDVESGSGFVTGDASDVQIFVYDVTNATLIRVAKSSILFANGTFQTTFPATSSTSYRLLFHVATTNATAWTLKFDNVKVGPQDVVYGPAMTDFQESDLFLASAGFGTVTSKDIFYRRVGDMLEVQGRFVSGTVAASAGYVELPSGLAIDYTKISTATNGQIVGHAHREGGVNGAIYALDSGQIMFVDGSTSNQVFVANLDSSTVGQLTKDNVDTYLVTNDAFTFLFRVPIVGWSTNVVSANSSSFRISSLLANGTRVTTTPVRLGEYRSRSKTTATSNTLADAAPTTAISAVNGLRLHAADYTSSQTSGEISVYEVYIGTFKHFKPFVYSATGLTGALVHDYDVISSTAAAGTQFSYDEKTGVLVISAGINDLATNTTRYIGRLGTALTYSTDGYVDAVISENALAVQQEPVRSSIRVTQGNGHGSTNTCIRRFVTTVESIGADITYADSAANGASFTINQSGVYSIHYKDAGGSPISWGISKNSSQLSTSIASITNADRLIRVSNGSGSDTNSVASATVYLSAGDIIRPHTTGTIAGAESDADQAFIITRVQ